MNQVYSVKEKRLLTRLVKENVIIEDKRKDVFTLELKKKAWGVVHTTYNSQPEVRAIQTVEQLKKLWNNLKQMERKETTALRQMMLASGVIPPAPEKPVLDPVLQVVKNPVPSTDVIIFYPCDSTPCETEQAEARSQLTELKEEVRVICADESNASTVSQASVVPSLSVSTSAASNCPPKKRKLPELVTTERTARVTKLTEASEQRQQLHEIRLQIANEVLQKVKTERGKAALELKKASYQAELAALQLQEFKKRGHILDIPN